MATILEVRKETARGSTRRFLMLLGLLMGSCVYMFYVMALTLQPGSLAECAREAGPDLGALPSGTSPVGADAFETSRADAANGAAAVAVAVTAAVLGSAAMVYWWLPTWRWRRLVPIDRVAEPAPDARIESLPEHVTRLAREAGLSRMPTFAAGPSFST